MVPWLKLIFIYIYMLHIFILFKLIDYVCLCITMCIYTHLCVYMCFRFPFSDNLGFFNPQTVIWWKEYLPEESAPWMSRLILPTSSGGYFAKRNWESIFPFTITECLTCEVWLLSFCHEGERPITQKVSSRRELLRSFI